MQTPILRMVIFICMTLVAMVSVVYYASWPLLVGIVSMYLLFAIHTLFNVPKTVSYKCIYSLLSGLALGLWGYSVPQIAHFDAFTITAAAVPGAMFGVHYGIIAALASLVYYLPDFIQGSANFTATTLLIVLASAFSGAAIGGRNLTQAARETREKDDLNFLLDYNLSIANCESDRELAEQTYASFLARLGARTGVVIAGQDEMIKLIPLEDNPLACLGESLCQQMLNTLAWETFQNESALKVEKPESSPLIPVQARDGLHGLALYAIPMRNMHDMVGMVLVYTTEQDQLDDSTLKVMQGAADNLARALTNINLVRRFRSLAMYDELTGLANRRAFFTRFAQELARAKRYNQPLGFAILDLDFFKSINDDFGHRMGDDVLKRAAEISLSCLRETDILGRIGGEEFAIIAVGSTGEATYQVAERIRLALAEEDFGIGRRVTMSGGVSAYPSRGATVDELFAVADKNLYEAKNLKRNMIVA